MGFLKYVFVLLLVVPVAVLMLYFVSNLSDKMKISIKNQKNNDSSAGRKVQESASAEKKAKSRGSFTRRKKNRREKSSDVQKRPEKDGGKAARLSEESVSMTYTDPQEHRRAEIISRIRRITAKNRK